jgi:hypothetical protein
VTGRPLRVDSDLSFSVDGPSGKSSGRLSAAGSTVTISLTNPAAAIGSAMNSGSPQAAAVGHFLASAGVTVDVVGPRGPVMTVGAGVDSAFGALLSGTRHLRLGSPRAIAPLVRARLTPPARVRRLLAVAAAALLILGISEQWLRSRRHFR